MTGVEPASKAWEAFILPMNYIRTTNSFLFYHILQFCKEKFFLIYF